MRAELYRPDAPESPVAVASWHGAAHLEVIEPVDGLETIFRATPVVTEDPSLRRLGTSGEIQLQPGSLEWFRAALVDRAPRLGLSVRFVSERVRGGWDPAAQYRPFHEQVERLASNP